MDKKMVADRLVALRGKKSQKEVADAVGVSVSTIAMYETGRRVPRDEVKVKLAKYFHKTVQSIFYT